MELWDPVEKCYYWYCERTQAAQWETPGEESVHHLIAFNENDESGYESGGAMTDYSTDNYESGDDATEFAGNSDWHEYWDDAAQAKYWYNNLTVRILSVPFNNIFF